MSDRERFRLLDLVGSALDQEATPAWSSVPEERRPLMAAAAREAALLALRCGVVPTLRDLALTRCEREAWDAASRALDHERATRLALALRAPGVDPGSASSVTRARLLEWGAEVDRRAAP